MLDGGAEDITVGTAEFGTPVTSSDFAFDADELDISALLVTGLVVGELVAGSVLEIVGSEVAAPELLD